MCRSLSPSEIAWLCLVRVFSDVLEAFLYFDICHYQWQISKYGKATLTSEKARIRLCLCPTAR